MKFTLALAFMLAGCEAGFRFGGLQAPVTAPPGDRIVIEGDKEVIEPVQPEPQCQARAAQFHGTVSLPCADIARRIRP